MTHILKIAAALVAGATSLASAQWTAVSLHPSGASSSALNGLDATRQAGSAVFAGRTEAVVWNGSANSYTNLHPNNLFDGSSATGFVNGVPVGTITDYIGRQHAVKWPTSGPAFVDLMPENCVQSAVWGAGGGQMCGWANYQSGPIPGGYWTTDYASWVSLTAPGAMRTYATACDGGTQVGWAVFSYQSRACVWRGSSATYLNLQPVIASNLTSAAFGTDGVQQVGYVNNSSALTSTACVWSGSAASVVYLNPPGVTHANASGVCGGKQVGSFTAATGASHACLWRGTPESMEDLHAALPAEYTSSSAADIVCIGNQSIVGGTAYNAVAGRNEAVIWIDVSCPTITSQPASAAVCPGEGASFEVNAMGSGELSFAWQYLDAGGAWATLTDGTVTGTGTVSGAGTPQLTIADTPSGTITTLRSTISNGCGTDATSDLVTLSGLTYAQCCSPPTFVTDPASTTQCQGGTAILTSLATGDGPIAYRWQWEQNPGEWENLSDDTIAGIGTLSGATTSTLTISNTQVGGPNTFRCRATDACGPSFSSEATLTGISTSECCANYTLDWSPSNWDACPGDNAFFDVGVTSNGPPTYQWQRQVSAGVWSNLSNGTVPGVGTVAGVTTEQLGISQVAPGANMDLRCVVTHQCGVLTSDAASLIVGGPGCCTADFDRDGFVTGEDFDAYVAAFELGDLSSDFDDDGFVTGDDFDAFVLAFESGC